MIFPLATPARADDELPHVMKQAPEEDLLLLFFHPLSQSSAGAAAPMTYLPNPKLVPLPMCTTSPRRSRSRKGCRSPRYVTRPTNPPSFMRASWRAEERSQSYQRRSLVNALI